MRGPKRLAWDETTELMKGVCRHRNRDSYNVMLGNGTTKLIKGLNEALVLRESYDCIQRMIAQLEPNQERLARNQVTNGGGVDQERAFAQRLRTAFEDLDWECHILNDFTLADIIVRPRNNGVQDAWWSLQVKTTAGRSKGSKHWSFHQVSHYGRMLVVCHALQGPNEDRPCTWVYDGETLAQHLPSGCMNVTPKGVWDDATSGRLLGKCEAHELEPCAHETAVLLTQLVQQYPRTSKQAAQWTLASSKQFVEFASLNFLMHSADSSVNIIALPETQQPHYDLEETCVRTCDTKLLQVKMAKLYSRCVDGTPTANSTVSGLNVSLMKMTGDRKKVPYDPTDFDVLVVVWRDVLCDLWHVWRIPIGDIKIVTKTGKLLTGIIVHVPIDVQRPPGVSREAAHGPMPRFKGDGRKGNSSNAYDWSIQYHACYPMCSAWDPPVPWPAELAYLQRRVNS